MGLYNYSGGEATIVVDLDLAAVVIIDDEDNVVVVVVVVAVVAVVVVFDDDIVDVGDGGCGCVDLFDGSSSSSSSSPDEKLLIDFILVILVVVTVVFLLAKERDRTGKLWQWMNLGVKFLRPVVVNGRLPLHTAVSYTHLTLPTKDGV